MGRWSVGGEGVSGVGTWDGVGGGMGLGGMGPGRGRSAAMEMGQGGYRRQRWGRGGGHGGEGFARWEGRKGREKGGEKIKNKK